MGRSHECDYPPGILVLPQATQPRFAVDVSSRKIDEQVKELASQAAALDALGVYDILPGALRKARPTHIVTQAQCDVCAVSEREVEAAVARESECAPQVVSLQPDSLSDIWEDFMRVATALGDSASGARLVSKTRDRMMAVAHAAKNIPAKPTVAAIEWVDPLMAVGNWMPELIDMAGGQCLFGKAGQHSPWLGFEDLVAADPDVIVLSPCGFGLERTLEDLPILSARPEWAALKAVRESRVFAADGNQFFNRPGPRLAETVEILGEMLHPDRFDFGHRGTAWLPALGAE